MTSSSSSIEPDKFDILCGKDKTCVNWPGSKRFRVVIDSYRGRYSEAISKYDKMLITKEIYNSLNETTSRFLKFNESTKEWEELTSMNARDKIGHSLRFANRKTKRGGSSSNVSVSSGDTNTASLPSNKSSSNGSPQRKIQTLSSFLASVGKGEEKGGVLYKTVSEEGRDVDEEALPLRPFSRFPSRTEYSTTTNSALALRKPAAPELAAEVESPPTKRTLHRRRSSQRIANKYHNRKHTVSIGGELWTMMQESITDWDVHNNSSTPQQQAAAAPPTVETLQQALSQLNSAAAVTTETSPNNKTLHRRRSSNRLAHKNSHNRKHTVSIGGELWTMMQESVTDWDLQNNPLPAEV